MQSGQLPDSPLQDYPERSVWTTWAISYQTIREKHKDTANLLVLWSFLDNKDLWHGLFVAASPASPVATRMLSKWIGDIASSEIKFIRAMQLLCNYSLAEVAAETTETTSYATHPVVHRWAHHSQGKRFATELSRLAVVAVGLTVPESSTPDYCALQRRLLLHAQACSSEIVNSTYHHSSTMATRRRPEVGGFAKAKYVLASYLRSISLSNSSSSQSSVSSKIYLN